MILIKNEKEMIIKLILINYIIRNIIVIQWVPYENYPIDGMMNILSNLIVNYIGIWLPDGIPG